MVSIKCVAGFAGFRFYVLSHFSFVFAFSQDFEFRNKQVFFCNAMLVCSMQTHNVLHLLFKRCFQHIRLPTKEDSLRIKFADYKRSTNSARTLA